MIHAGCSEGDKTQQKVMLTALLARIHEQVWRQWKHKVSWDGLSFVELWVYKCIDGTLNESKPDWKSNKRRIDWKTEWKKTEDRGRTQGLFLCLPSFLWHWRHCLYMIMKISLTDWLNKVSALCAVLKKKTCRNTTHYFTHFTTSFWPHFNQPGEPSGIPLVRLANLH